LIQDILRSRILSISFKQTHPSSHSWKQLQTLVH